MRLTKRSRILILAQMVIPFVIAVFASWNPSTASASLIGYTDIGTATPHTAEWGNATNLLGQLWLFEDASYRLFDSKEANITWNPTNQSQINSNSDNYAMAFHIFNYNTNCWRANVTKALDGNGNPLPGSFWATNLPNARSTGDYSKNAACSGQSGSWEQNEVRFNLRYQGQGSLIGAGPYYAEATFVDYNYPAARAWIEVTYNYIHDNPLHHDIYYDGQYGNKTCVNGYNQLNRGWTCP